MLDAPPDVGRTVQERPLHAVRIGAADAPRRVLVVGAMHGEEPGGRRVADAVTKRKAPEGTQIWVVRDLNPDGSRRGTRANARGVDLNRNFPHRWRRTAKGRFHGGPRAASEPETTWAMRLVRQVRPHVSVWFHQPYGIVVPTAGVERPLVDRYARVSGLPVRRLPRYRGTAAGWSNAILPGGGAFVVELAAGRPSSATVRRHVRAIHAVARPPARAARAARAAERPDIAWTPIPYGSGRRAQMRRYALRHNGVNTAALRDPKTIVQHFTVSDTFKPVFDLFASNGANMGEKPGTCTHFVIERDGTIHQLVPLRLMCRHVVGLNHVSIGIEHVGRSDAQVMGNERQLDASLRLTRWLQDRHGILTRHVIGHAESLSSPFHHERVASWRRLTHEDFQRATMRRYRRLLG